MRKVFALVIGLLVLGGMMGMVSADFAGSVLHVNNEYSTYYSERREVPWTEYNTLGEVTQFSVQYDAAIGRNYDASNSSECIAIMEIYTDYGTYGFYYCPDSTTVIIKGSGQSEQSTAVDPMEVNPAHTFKIIATKTGQNTWNITFVIDPDQTNEWTYTYTGVTMTSIYQVRAGTSTSGPKYDLYIDNVLEEVKAGTSTITTPEEFDDGNDNYFTNDLDGGGTEDFVDSNSVPFFSNAGIAAVTLLLVLGAVWFFRRQ